MKKTEIIELNGAEYTLTLNRESFLQIDKICNIKQSMKILQSNIYEYVDEIDDDYDPFAIPLSQEEFDNQIQKQDEVIYKIVERSFFIWLYPEHKLTISQVKEIVDPYLEDENKSSWIADEMIRLLQECVAIKEKHEQERKNLKALANK